MLAFPIITFGKAKSNSQDYLKDVPEENQSERASKLLDIANDFLAQKKMDSVQIYIDLALEAALLSGDMAKVGDCFESMGRFHFLGSELPICH